MEASENVPPAGTAPGPAAPVGGQTMATDAGPADATPAEIARLTQVMSTLRRECPWDARQTHRSLVPYLIEETCEVAEAIEANDPEPGHLREELGDLLFQVIFHSAIAGESDQGFELADVARAVADKLIARHPAIYGVNRSEDGSGLPDDANDSTDETAETVQSLDDLERSWEVRKAREKARGSVLDGIPEQFSALARANKIITRARAGSLPVTLPDDPIDETQFGRELIHLVARGHASGIDAEQAARDAVRDLSTHVAAEELDRSEPR